MKHKIREVEEELEKYGFKDDNYNRVIVTWDATEKARDLAVQAGIEIWYFPVLLRDIANAHKEHRTYFIDDTALTIQLYAMASEASTDK